MKNNRRNRIIGLIEGEKENKIFILNCFIFFILSNKEKKNNID